MATMHDIQRFCDASWRRLAEASKDERHRLAERFLSQLGWTSPDPLSLVPFGVPIPTVSYLLRAGGTTLAAHFVSPGILEPPSNLASRGLDYCDASRLLVDVTGAVGAHYAFLTDLQKACIYDVEKDELLLHADIPSEFVREFNTVLMREEVEAGSLHEIRRQPRSFVARQLREWNLRWCDILTQQARLQEDQAQLVLDRLLVLRFLFYHDILNPEEWDLESRMSDLLLRALSEQPRGAGRMLRQLCSDLWTDWHADLFAPDPAIEQVIQQDRIAVPLLREYALLSQSKFSLRTILESFNYGDAAEKARVRTIPEDHPGRSAYLGKQQVGTVHEMKLELDIDEEGYRTIFHWFDKLVEVMDRLQVEARVQARRTDGPLRGLDSSDFGDRRATTAPVDRFCHIVENALVVYYATPRQLRTSRLMLYLHLINCYEESGLPFGGFPSFDCALQPRPRLLDSDRQRIYGAAPTRYEEWEVI